MATRYWVGGTGTWNTTSTTNWSTTSGGSGGASVPTSSDDVIFDANSGTGSAVVTGSGGNCAGFTYDSAALVTFAGYINVYGTFFSNRAATTALSALQVVMRGTSISMAVDSYVQELDIQPPSPTYTVTAFGNIYAKYLNVSSGWTLDLSGRFARTNKLNLQGTVQNGSIYFSAINSTNQYLYSDGVWSGVTIYVETGTYPALVNTQAATGATVGDIVFNATSQVTIQNYIQAKNITINSGATIEPSGTAATIYCYGNFYLASGATLKLTGTLSAYFYVYINKVPGSSTATRTLRVDGTLLDLSTANGIGFYINSGADTVNVPGSGFGSSAHPAGGVVVQSTANFSCGTIYAFGFVVYASVACDISALSSLNTQFVQNLSIGLVPGNCAVNFYKYSSTYGYGYLYSTGATLAAVTVVDAIPVQIRDNTTFGNLTCASSLGQGSTKGLEFEPGSTQTVTGNFVLSGASASDRVNLTIHGSGAAATITKAAGTVTASYANISYSNATGGATFKAPLTTNIDGGNNTGWIFGIPGGGNFFSFF